MTTETQNKSAEKQVSLANRIRAFKLNNPKATPKDIATALGIKVTRVYATNFYDNTKKKAKKLKKAKTSPWATVAVATSNKPVKPQTDPVNHPAHYKVGGVETIDFIEAKRLNYNLGNVVKYITRADHKGNTAEDLQKARWYLNRELAAVTKAERGGK